MTTPNIIPKTATLHNSVDPSQHILFMWIGEWGFVKTVYQMGHQGWDSNIIVKVSNGLSMDLFHSQAYNLDVADARAVWAYLVDELGWKTWEESENGNR